MYPEPLGDVKLCHEQKVFFFSCGMNPDKSSFLTMLSLVQRMRVNKRNCPAWAISSWMLLIKRFCICCTCHRDRDTFAATLPWKPSSKQSSQPRVLAEDSGLVVEALDVTWSLFSSFRGTEASDDDNNALLIEQLSDVPSSRRTAYYACHAALAAPDGTIKATSEGRCFGRIAKSAHGKEGFGYDPYFIIPEYHQTLGELSPAVKGLISHRGRAIRAMIPMIVKNLKKHSV